MSNFLEINLIMGDESGFARVPKCYRRLARLVSMAVFDEDKERIIKELVTNRCMTEDDLLEQLPYKQCTFRSLIAELKSNGFVQQRRKVVRTGEKKRSVNYYFLNYLKLLDMVTFEMKPPIDKQISALVMKARTRKKGLTDSLINPLPNNPKHPLYIGRIERKPSKSMIGEDDPARIDDHSNALTVPVLGSSETLRNGDKVGINANVTEAVTEHSDSSRNYPGILDMPLLDL